MHLDDDHRFHAVSPGWVPEGTQLNGDQTPCGEDASLPVRSEDLGPSMAVKPNAANEEEEEESKRERESKRENESKRERKREKREKETERA